MNKQQQAKYGLPTLLRGFLILYIRDIVKVTKVTNINQSTIEEYIQIKKERGMPPPAGAPAIIERYI